MILAGRELKVGDRVILDGIENTSFIFGAPSVGEDLVGLELTVKWIDGGAGDGIELEEDYDGNLWSKQDFSFPDYKVKPEIDDHIKGKVEVKVIGRP